MKKIPLLSICLLIGYGCAKQEIPSTTKAQKNIVLEYVDMALLQKYISYSQALERKAVSRSAVTLPAITKSEFQAMIDNYLANERNAIREHKLIMSIMKQNDPGNNDPCVDENNNIIDCPPPPASPEQVNCTGTFEDYNTVNTITFSATLEGSVITSEKIGFGGVGGTYAPSGEFVQKTYNDVITYQQYYTETISFFFGLTWTQTYVIYGNAYPGGCTTHGLHIVNE